MRKIRKILELENLGAEVLVLSADVTDLNQMAQVVEQIHGRFGALNGVVTYSWCAQRRADAA